MNNAIKLISPTEAVILVFDLSGYNLQQAKIALLCPLNRMTTKAEYAQKLNREITDMDLFQNPDWLLEHFTANGGATEFGKRRDEFMRRKRIKLPDEPEYSI